MVKFIQKIIFIVFISAVLLPQTQDSLHLKNQQLDNIKKEISRLESELRNKSAKEKESLQALENINQQKLLLNKLINNLIEEENYQQLQIDETNSKIQQLETKINLLKEKYSNYVVWVYKNRGLSMLRFLLDAGSFNQTLKRYQYLQYISEQNRKTLSQLVENKKELSALKKKYENELSEKENLVLRKVNEQKELASKETEGKKILNNLRADQKLIAAEIESKRRAEILIKNIIARLIEEDRIRRSKLIEKKPSDRNKIPTYNYGSFENFALLKGNLNWPVVEGKISRKFGENKNVKLNTVTLNYGIDISVNDDELVKAVAEGVVSAIDWIPGYGSIIILTHRDEFRTVYGHVADITVKEGEKIKGGHILGKVNQSLEGNILHFEIWNERNYQNPEVWLARR